MYLSSLLGYLKIKEGKEDDEEKQACHCITDIRYMQGRCQQDEDSISGKSQLQDRKSLYQLAG